MKIKGFRNVAVVLPLSYKYARNVRLGVSEWADAHGGWRLIELDPGEMMRGTTLAAHLDGVITYHKPSDPLGIRGWRLPVVNCGLGPEETGKPQERWGARVVFDRDSMNRLAVDHFRGLGMECVGYVGRQLRGIRRRAKRVSGLRRLVLEAGMEWVEFDLGEVDPMRDPSLIWRWDACRELQTFLGQLPASTGLLGQDDYVGVLLCETAHELGLEIPGELAVLGQGDRLIGRSGPVPLSTVEIPGVAVGRKAAAVLDGWMSGERPEPMKYLLPCERIVVRESTGGHSGDLGIERARRHLDRHALEGITVQELAEVAGCSTRTLREKFRAVFGIEIAPEMRERRREEALRLLADSDLEIGEIGKRCGFDTPSNFFNFVRRQAGGGPTAYRRRVRNG